MSVLEELSSNVREADVLDLKMVSSKRIMSEQHSLDPRRSSLCSTSKLEARSIICLSNCNHRTRLSPSPHALHKPTPSLPSVTIHWLAWQVLSGCRHAGNHTASGSDSGGVGRSAASGVSLLALPLPSSGVASLALSLAPTGTASLALRLARALASSLRSPLVV